MRSSEGQLTLLPATQGQPWAPLLDDPAPTHRPLLHLTAVVVIAVSVSSLWIIRAAPFLGSAWLLYAGLWLVYYINSVRPNAT